MCGGEKKPGDLGGECFHLACPQLFTSLWRFPGEKENWQLGEEAEGVCIEENGINNQTKA